VKKRCSGVQGGSSPTLHLPRTHQLAYPVPQTAYPAPPTHLPTRLPCTSHLPNGLPCTPNIEHVSAQITELRDSPLPASTRLVKVGLSRCPASVCMQAVEPPKLVVRSWPFFPSLECKKLQNFGPLFACYRKISEVSTKLRLPASGNKMCFMLHGPIFVYQLSSSVNDLK
jgi:hypothetical protein